MRRRLLGCVLTSKESTKGWKLTLEDAEMLGLPQPKSAKLGLPIMDFGFGLQL